MSDFPELTPYNIKAKALKRIKLYLSGKISLPHLYDWVKSQKIDCSFIKNLSALFCRYKDAHWVGGELSLRDELEIILTKFGDTTYAN